MADVLLVAAFQLRYPVLDRILMIADDLALHHSLVITGCHARDTRAPVLLWLLVICKDR
jgi:hypothetical protein